jgi:hypothetical protein
VVGREADDGAVSLVEHVCVKRGKAAEDEAAVG